MKSDNDNTSKELDKVKLLLQTIMEEDESEAVMEDTERLF